MDEAQAYRQLKANLSDREWRLSHLYYIKNKDGLKVLLRPNWAQKTFYAAIWYFNVILKARQLGFSTFISIYFLDATLFNSNHRCGIIDSGIDDAKKKLKMIKFAYDNLPEFIKQQVPMTTNAAELIEFANGSGISVGTSHRGDTLQKLLISEYGKVSAATPEKAREIKTGALNAVGIGQQIFVESTAEGKSGEFYELCQSAMKLKDSGKELSRLEPKFHFYAWFNNPDYKLSDLETAQVVLPADTEAYLAKFPLMPNQKAWYAIKEKIMGEDMRREYPSTPEEAFEGSMEGAYYSKEMALVRQAGQITNVPYDRSHPVNTYWDIGQGSDQMSIIFYQNINNRHNIINYHESSNEGWDFYANLLRSMNYVYGMHYFPHDGNKKIIGTEVQTTRQLAEQVGIRPIQIISVTKSVHLDIMNYCKPLLPNVWFDESKADLLINRLDNYSRRWDRINAMWLNDPKHDEASHGSDAFRTMVMAINQSKQEVVADIIEPGHFTQTSYARRH